MSKKRSIMKRLKKPAIAIALLIAVGVFVHGAVNEVHQQEKEMQQRQEKIIEINEKLDRINAEIEDLQTVKERLRTVEQEVSRSAARTMSMEITAYDLSVESCGKAPGTYGYGITATGVNLAGHSWDTARAIAVDPSVIPLGSRVRIKFDNPAWQHLNGTYRAVDTGGGISGNHIDLFMGEGSYSECVRFGKQTAKVEIL